MTNEQAEEEFNKDSQDASFDGSVGKEPQNQDQDPGDGNPHGKKSGVTFSKSMATPETQIRESAVPIPNSPSPIKRRKRTPTSAPAPSTEPERTFKTVYDFNVKSLVCSIQV